MTSKRRKLPNRRSCFLSGLKAMEAVGIYIGAMPKPLLVVVEPQLRRTIK